MRTLTSLPAEHFCLCAARPSPVTLSCSIPKLLLISLFPAIQDIIPIAKTMPVEETDGRLYKWCVCCHSNIPDMDKTVCIHINRAHGMEMLPGCPRSWFYFRSSWSNVKKHCSSHHHLDIGILKSFGGCAWGLTPVDTRGGKPTYAHLCHYSLRMEAWTPCRRLWLPRPPKLHNSGCPRL